MSSIITRPHKWWKEATGYQIYPASFKDTNGDGIGDLNGITESLDYLKALGVDFIWISPVYESPDYDMGYDISDYEKISSKYGSMEDMDNLIREAKARGLRVLMDLVVNHTSHHHRWFQESKKSRTNPYSDWYIWRDPIYTETGERKPPSNWQGVFGGSTWTYVPERDQYYFHLCLEEQPDLNWDNQETRKAIYASAAEFWLKKGVDGFRVDLVNAYCKNQAFPDAPVVNSKQEVQPLPLEHVINGPKMHEWLKEERTEVLDRYGDDVVLIGELPATDRSEVLNYVSAESRELNMTIDFGLFIAGNHWSLKMHDMRRHKLPELKDAIALTQGLVTGVNAWTTTFLENHDSARSLDHFGPGEGEYTVPAAKLLALFATTLSGTLIIYQGQEIGMANIPKDTWKEDDFKDQVILRYFREIEETYPGDAAMKEKAFQAALQRGRDNTRTPMQWSSESPHGGFTTGTPWLRVNPNYEKINVASQLGDEHSVLAFWKAAVASRKQYPDIFIHGEYQVVDAGNEKTFSFWKKGLGGKESAFVVLNFSSEQADNPLPTDDDTSSLQLLISNTDKKQYDPLSAPLEPWEGRVFIKRESTSITTF
ncbi:glycoside hydrolase family 13 protein [Biscogniauxia marginata]|nr:glycoside hydrolase family 13 protein [Biscogniauxia marginata]